MALAQSDIRLGRLRLGHLLLGGRVRALVSSAAAIVLATLVGALLIVIAGGRPLPAYEAMLDGTLGSPVAFGQVLAVAAPLVIIGLGLALAFRGRVYNIGAEGQLFMGALGGGALAVILPVSSGPVLVALAIGAGVVAGAFWGWIVGALRARWGVNEVITSLLLNFVAIFAFTYVVRRPLSQPESAQLQGEAIPSAAVLPDIPEFLVHIGILLPLALVPIVAYLMNRTPFGFRTRMIGFNPEAARAAGVPSGHMVVWLMVISGGLAGLAGVLQVLGISGRLDPDISQNYGFTAIVVALLGRLHAVGVLIGGLFMAMLLTGGQALSVGESLPFAIVLAIQGMFIVFFVIADRLARG
ncbi:MAG: ABC transporter permease [Gaiellaceae bacterium]